MADWLDTRDPWLTTRMRHATRIAHWEREIGAAVVEAMTQFLDAARAGVLGEPGSTGLTAAAEPPADQPPPQEPPSLDGWPSDVVWETLLTDVVLPVVGQAFDEAFERAYRAVITASEIEPYRVIYLGTVFDRLRLWPRGAFDEIRDELADGIAAGETVDQLRNRVGRALRIDARSRAIEDRIAELDAHIDDPATPAEQRRAARAERRQLYNDLDIENSRWWWQARRIARTETIGSYSAGAYYSAEAWEQTSGDEMWLQWLATSDTRTRGAHIVADGQVRRLGQPFTVGGVAMRFPGDPLAPAHLVVNCRCTLLALGADEATGQQALYERTRPDRTDIHGNKLDDTGRPIVAAAQPEDTTMPYHVAESDQCPGGEPWAVIKTSDGEVMGCHETRAAADEQLAAICANDPDDCASDSDPAAPGPGATLPNYWRGTLPSLDTGTVSLPVPLQHPDTGTTVGTVDRTWTSNDQTWGEGQLNTIDEPAAALVRAIADGQITGLDAGADAVLLVAEPAEPDARITAVATMTPLPTDPVTPDTDQIEGEMLDLEASAWTEMQNLPPMPAAWFAEPTAEELPPGSGGVHYDNGRIYGWVAQAGVPHAVHGYTIEQLGDIDFTEFLRSQRTLDDGTSVRVGAFTMNVGHHRDGAECETAACQFDDTRTVAGIITVGMNDGGMWFSGAGAPWISEWDRQVFAACQPSYHMKPGDDGRYQLRAVLTVPVPAHSSALAASVVRRSNLALAASAAAAAAVLEPVAVEPAPAAAVIPSAEAIGAALHREIQAAAARARTAGQLQQRMTGPRVAALTARMRSV